MEIFKIISDPYKKEIKFETVVTETEETIPVTRNDNSNLVSDELVHGFFPYNNKKIIDEIYEIKYKQGQQIEIMFEGTADDYNALRNLCSREKYADKIKLLAQKKYLNSAKDILPKISEIFEKVKPLVDDTIFSDEKFKADMQKLEDTVNRQMVPICVIGNYSSGKSTFVNALIGREILPSGDDPVTDCVYRIIRSPDKECGCVQFEYKGKTVRFLINSDGHHDGFVSYGQSIPDDKFLSGLKEKLASCSSKSACFRIHTLLFAIEEHKKQTKNHDTQSDISSLIQICIPFSKEGVLSESKCDYVIFDTPGESSASNEYHSDVLQKQMQSLSNGLVAFSGSLLAQYQGFADVNMGRGSIVIGLAAVIIGQVIGEAIFRKNFNFILRLTFVVVGGILYYLVMGVVLWLKMPPEDLKLFTAIIVAIFLAVPYLRGKSKNSFKKVARMNKKIAKLEDESNA